MDRQIIKHIDVKGFRSIESASLDLGHVNVLIGINGAGKSNFINAFQMLKSIQDGKLQRYVAKNGGADSVLFYGSKHTDSLDMKLEIDDCAYGFSLEPAADDRLIFRDEYIFDNAEKVNLGNGHAESRLNGEKKRSFFQKMNWSIYHFSDTGETSRMKQYQGINDNIELASDGRNLAPFMFRLKHEYQDNYTRIRDVVRMVAPFFDDFVLRPNPLNKETIRLEWRDLNGDVPFRASQISDGTLRFICLAVLLLQPDELLPDMLLIDEPELGLHPYAIQLLAALIKKRSRTCQIIVSTQSVELLNEFDASDVIVADHKSDHSEFRRLDKDRLKQWVDDDYTLGELWQKNILGGRP